MQLYISSFEFIFNEERVIRQRVYRICIVRIKHCRQRYLVKLFWVSYNKCALRMSEFFRNRKRELFDCLQLISVLKT